MMEIRAHSHKGGGWVKGLKLHIREGSLSIAPTRKISSIEMVMNQMAHPRLQGPAQEEESSSGWDQDTKKGGDQSI